MKVREDGNYRMKCFCTSSGQRGVENAKWMAFLRLLNIEGQSFNCYPIEVVKAHMVQVPMKISNQA